MINIVLTEPDIPQNSGNIARLCAANNFNLFLVGELGFTLSDRHLKRAGLDYWEYVRMQHISWDAFNMMLKDTDAERVHLLTKHGKQSYTTMTPRRGDYFIFGSETDGLPNRLLEKYKERWFVIPMENKNVRSLNLATSVGIVAYHARYLIESREL